MLCKVIFLYPPPPGTGVEEEDGGIYDNRLLTIQQIPSAGGSDEIDCTPPPQRRGEIPPVNEYGNLELDGSPKVKRNTRFKARPLPNPLANGSHEPSTKSHDLAAKDLYDNATVESAAASGSGPKENMYDDPHYLGRVAPKRVLTSTPAGTYDNPGEIIPSLSPKGAGEDYTDIESQPARESVCVCVAHASESKYSVYVYESDHKTISPPPPPHSSSPSREQQQQQK